MSPDQPDAPHDFLGIDWAALEASAANSLSYTGSVPEYLTASPDPNLMFPGLDPAWMLAPTLHNYGHTAPAHVTPPIPYPEPAPTPGLELIFDYETPITSSPSGASAYPSPALSQLSCYATPAPSHVPAYSSPITSYGAPTPSSLAQPPSAFDSAYVSTYSSPSPAAPVHNPAQNPALCYPVPSFLGPNRVAHTKSSVRSKPYVRTPSMRTKILPIVPACPLTDPNFDWDRLKSPTAGSSDQGLVDGSMFGWAEAAPPSSVTPVHPTPDHTAWAVHKTQTAQASGTAQTIHVAPIIQTGQTPWLAGASSVLPWQVVPSDDFQALATSAPSESTTSSPAPSLSFLQVETSPAAQSPSSMPLVFDPEKSRGSSTVLAPIPTKPTFPALVPSIPSTPVPEPTPTLTTGRMTQTTLAPASTPIVIQAPIHATALPKTPKVPVIAAPPRPALALNTVPTHSQATTTTKTPLAVRNPIIPNVSEQISFPVSLSAFAADEPLTSTPLSTPSPNLVGDGMTFSSSLASIPTLASAQPVSQPLASRTDVSASVYNGSETNAPIFTWPAAPTAPAMSYSADSSVGLGLELDDEINMDIALAAGIHLGDTGFQSAERLSEIASNPPNPPEQLLLKQNQVRRTKRVARPKMKWNGSLGGELTKPRIAQNANDQVCRWTFSERPLSLLNPSSLDATHRTPGDIHFSPAPEFPESGPEFVTWVAVRAGETRVQWVEWQEGHPHPAFTGYVLRPARLAHSKPPRWIRKASWLKAVAKGKRSVSSTDEESSS
ncbi:hypothetical protein RhiLY_12283 [Ceratobasidium sp. AG-Ba]|nr:hypothetical protein RhiLY_12283 [Ceratobasidium sp. AG-Ba]